MEEQVMSRRLLSLTIIISFALGAVGSGSASGPSAVIGKIDKVTMLPDNKQPTEIIIEGVFMLSIDYTWKYTSPAFGYMYFACQAGEETTCKLQWNDLAYLVANPDQKLCAMFGDQQKNPGSVRIAGTTPAKPDPYYLGVGLQKTPSALAHCPTLWSAVAPSPDAGPPKPDLGPIVPPSDSGLPPDQALAKPDSGPAARDTIAITMDGAPATEGTVTTKDGGCVMGGHPASTTLLLFAIVIGLGLCPRRSR
jgi:hypothetical protein